MKDFCPKCGSSRPLREGEGFSSCCVNSVLQELKDTDFLYRAFYVLASEKGVKPGSREMIEAAARFDAVLKRGQE